MNYSSFYNEQRNSHFRLCSIRLQTRLNTAKLHKTNNKKYEIKTILIAAINAKHADLKRAAHDPEHARHTGICDPEM